MPAVDKSKAELTKELLVETRRRSRTIDEYLDMIPPRSYLGSELLHEIEAEVNRKLDPAEAKRTSQISAEIAAAQAAEQAVAAKAASAAQLLKAKNKGVLSKTQKRRLLRLGTLAANPSASSAPIDDSSAKAPTGLAKSRDELKQRLAQKLAGLKEERRQRQSEKDKAAAAAVRAARPTKDKPSVSEAAEKVASSNQPEAAEIARLNFTKSSADAPFEAQLGRKGAKMARLRKELRRQEGKEDKLQRAETRGNGDERRLKVAMDNALMRARGEKVHDDVSKLRKAQKNLELQKAKGRKRWEAKKDLEKQQGKDKQARRMEALQSRGSKKKKLKTHEDADAGGD